MRYLIKLPLGTSMACLLLFPLAAQAEVPFFNPASGSSIEATLAELTLEEKVRLLHGSAMFYSGGVERLGIPELAFTDGPLGIREEVSRDSWDALGLEDDYATYFPTGTALAATWNPDLALIYGEAFGREARARDKDILLAPAINLIRTPLCGRNYEYFSEEPLLIARMAVPYVQGVQRYDVAACVKHFAVNNQETNRSSISVELDQRTLHEVYLSAFRATVIEGEAGAVMGAYNRVRGIHVCEHDYLLNTVLKDKWGFQGLVVSDWNATHSTIDAARHGLDVEMGTTSRAFEDFYFARPLLQAVRNGDLEEAVVDEMARRVLRVRQAIRQGSPDRAVGEINTRRHSNIVRDVAREAIVLLKNEDQLLPLDLDTIRSIAVIGDNATRQQSRGGFGASVKAAYEVPPLEGLQAALGDQVEIHFAQGYHPQYGGNPLDRAWRRPIDHRPDRELIAEAVELAQASDLAIIVAGTNRDVESEARDRPDLRLPFGQEALIRAVQAVNPRTIVVIVAGAAVDLSEVEARSSTLVWAWFNGAESGHALADVITGAVNPSGKLPFTLPRRLHDLGPHALDAFPGDGETIHYREGIHVGYRWLDRYGIEPLYPFGFGLSYTSFFLQAAEIEKDSVTADATIRIHVSLQNTGEQDGHETLQVYAAFPEASIDRPKRQLVGFQKVFLQAGEERRIPVEIPVQALAFFDESAHAFRVPAERYQLQIGTSSRDLPFALDIEVRD